MPRPKNREEFRREVADAFIASLNEHGLEWTATWSRAGGGERPRNAVTEKFYRGVNAFYLSAIAQAGGYTDPRWATFHQIAEEQYHPGEKWHLKAGSKAAHVEYWFPRDNKAKKAISWEKLRGEIMNGRDPSEFSLLVKYYDVFNASCIDGISPLPEPEAKTDITPDDLVGLISMNMGVPIYHDGGDQAFYSGAEDAIHLPSLESFFTDYGYASTALHELAHATGHASRLNRDIANVFGSEKYAYEELVAEIASTFAARNLKVPLELTPQFMDNHKAYVGSWILSISEKPDTLLRAIKDADKAADFMELKAGLLTEREYKEARAEEQEQIARKMAPAPKAEAPVLKPPSGRSL